MAKVTVEFDKGDPHTYNNVPDNVVAEPGLDAAIKKRAEKDFPGRNVTRVGVEGAAAAPTTKPADTKPEPAPTTKPADTKPAPPIPDNVINNIVDNKQKEQAKKEAEQAKKEADAAADKARKSKEDADKVDALEKQKIAREKAKEADKNLPPVEDRSKVDTEKPADTKPADVKPADVKPEPAPATKPEPAPATKPEPAPATKPEPAPATKPEPAPAPATKPEPAPAPATKPEPAPATKPADVKPSVSPPASNTSPSKADQDAKQAQTDRINALRKQLGLPATGSQTASPAGTTTTPNKTPSAVAAPAPGPAPGPSTTPSVSSTTSNTPGPGKDTGKAGDGKGPGSGDKKPTADQPYMPTPTSKGYWTDIGRGYRKWVGDSGVDPSSGRYVKSGTIDVQPVYWDVAKKKGEAEEAARRNLKEQKIRLANALGIKKR